MTVLLTNNVSTTLAADIAAGDATFTVVDGSRFPSPAAGQYAYATIIAPNGAVEIVKITSRVSNALGVARAQEGTLAQVFPAGSRVELRVTAATVLDAVADGVADVDADIAALDVRLDTAESDITALEGRMTTAESDITALEGRMTTAEGDITTIEGDIVALEAFDTGLATSAGSASVGFLQSGTGASLRTVQTKLRETVSVKDFGAAGDGVADDTTEIQAALARIASTGGILLFPPGTYKITSGLTQAIADGISVTISGYGAKIDATALTSLTPNVIQLGGGRATATTPGAGITKNADTFTVSSATGISVGRVLLITSTDLWNPTRPYYYKGEMAMVERISGTTITNSNFMYDSYTAGTTTIHLLNMPYVTVEGLEIIANADLTGLSLDYVRNPIVRNCTVRGARYAGINVGYFFGGLVDGNYVYDAWNGVVTGTSYGVSVGTGQGCKVSNNTLYNARHAVTCGGFEPGREIIVCNNVCHTSTLENLTGAIDLHGNTELCTISGNIATNINCSGINAIIVNNQLVSAEADVPGITIFQEISSSFYSVQNNRIVASGATAYGIWLCPAQPNLTVDVLTVSGNNIISTLSSVRLQPRNVSSTSCAVTTCVVSDNVLQVTGSDSAFSLVRSGAVTYAVADLLSSNNVYQSGYTCFFTDTTVTLTKSVGDVFKSNRAGSYHSSFGGVDVHLTAPIFRGNIGGAGASRSVYYTNTGRIDVLNPIYKDINERAEIASATTYAESGWYGATPTVLNTAGAKLISFYGALGRAIAYGTAAPTTNTWAVGDRVYNQSPVAGQPKSWVCTVAGTPGTWVSEGNL